MNPKTMSTPFTMAIGSKYIAVAQKMSPFTTVDIEWKYPDDAEIPNHPPRSPPKPRRPRTRAALANQPDAGGADLESVPSFVSVASPSAVFTSSFSAAASVCHPVVFDRRRL